ncbi:MAG: hypothetical protein CVU88_05560, partial [Firmicutes bacterium HGW-Firmicutes-13]
MKIPRIIKGLKLKIIILMMILVVIFVNALGIISYFLAANILTEAAESEFNTIVGAIQYDYNDRIRSIENQANLVLSTAELRSYIEQNNNNFEEISLYFEEAVNNNKGIEYLRLISNEGIILASNARQVIGDDIGSGEFVKKALEGESGLGDIVISSLSNNAVVPYVTPVYNSQGELRGALMVSVNFGQLIGERVERERIGKTGYTWMVDKTGLLVSHPVKDYIFTKNLAEDPNEDLREIIKRMHEGETGRGEYHFEGFKKVTVFTSVGPWYLAFTMNEEEFLAPANYLKVSNILISIIAMALSAVLAFLLSGQIITPIKKVEFAMNSAAEGDLTRKVEVKSGDEIGIMARNFNKMLDSLKELIGQVSESATRVSEMSDNMASSAESMSSSIQEVASSTNEFASSSHLLGKNCQEMASSADEASENASEGEEVIKKAVSQMRNINNIMKELEGVVERLGERSQEISKIVGVITAIAEQTNLLALNAAIEAARAGEQG